MSETITVTGNIASEPEQRTFGDGGSVTSFRIASTHRKFDRASNSWVDGFTNYFSVSAFRSLGVNAFASLHRGDRVIVSGRLRLREWDNGTRKGINVEIDAEAIGHDLLFGVTTYQRSGSPNGGASALSSGAGSPDGSAERGADEGDSWAIPVGDAGRAEPELETVGAGDRPF